MNQATVYSKNDCPYCVKAKQILSEKGVEVTEIKIPSDMTRDKFAEFIEPHLNDKDLTVPQIFVDGEYVGGCDDLEAKLASEESYNLDFEDFSL